MRHNPALDVSEEEDPATTPLIRIDPLLHVEVIERLQRVDARAQEQQFRQFWRWAVMGTWFLISFVLMPFAAIVGKPMTILVMASGALSAAVIRILWSHFRREE